MDGDQILFVLLGTLASFTNSTFIVVILVNKRLRNTTNWLLVSLSLSDALVGCLSSNFQGGLLNTAAKQRGDITECTALILVLVSFPYISVLHMALAAFERYVTILYPLRYFLILTPRRLAITVGMCWCAPLLGFGIWSFAWHKLETNIGNASNFTCGLDDVTPCYVLDFMLGSIFVFYVFTVAMYARIFFVAIAQVRRVASETGENRYRYRVVRSQVKVAVLLFITTGAFTISYLPLVISISAACTEDGNMTEEDDKKIRVFGILAFLNSALNPFIYGAGNRPIRKAFVECCRKLKTSGKQKTLV